MGAKKSLEQEWLKTTHIAKIMGLNAETIRREINSGKLKAQMFHGEYLVNIKDFEEWKAREIRSIPNV